MRKLKQGDILTLRLRKGTDEIINWLNRQDNMADAVFHLIKRYLSDDLGKLEHTEDSGTDSRLNDREIIEEILGKISTYEKEKKADIQQIKEALNQIIERENYLLHMLQSIHEQNEKLTHAIQQRDGEISSLNNKIDTLSLQFKNQKSPVSTEISSLKEKDKNAGQDDENASLFKRNFLDGLKDFGQ